MSTIKAQPAPVHIRALSKGGEASTSGQDGGIGKHALPPHANTERITARPQNK